MLAIAIVEAILEGLVALLELASAAVGDAACRGGNRNADSRVGIGMLALVGPSWREGVGKRKTENEYFVKSSASRFPNRRGWIGIKKLALTNRFP